MLKSLLKLIRNEQLPAARLRAAVEALAAEHAEAERRLEAANEQMVQAAVALGEGRPDADKLADDARAEQLKARERLEELDAMQTAIATQIEATEAQDAAADRQQRLGTAATLLAEREALAGELQRHLEKAAALFAKIDALRAEAIGAHPEGRARARAMGEFLATDRALAAAVSQVLQVHSGGLIGDPRCLGGWSLVEMRQRLQPIAETVARVNRQFYTPAPDLPRAA